MTDNVVSLWDRLRCASPRCRCGAVGMQVTLVGAEGQRATIRACDACLMRTSGTLDRVRPVFEKMIECGVHREVASAAMTYLLDRMDEWDGT